MFAVVYLLMMIMYRENPSTPPSPVAEVEAKALNFFEAFSLLKKDANFRNLMIAFSLKQGAMAGFALFISDILTPFGYSAKLLAAYGFMFFFTGLFGSIFYGILADRTRRFKCILLVLLGTIITGITSMLIVTKDVYSARLILTLVFTTFSSAPLTPMSLNFAAELTFPINPGVINGGMIIALNASSFVIGVIFNFILQLNDSTYENYTLEQITVFE